MIRVYLDWNVFTNLQQENNETFSSILRILKENSSSILLPYSMAHLDDLRRGMGKNDDEKELIDIDLKFLFDLTGGHYLHLDTDTGTLSPRMENPSKLFHGLSKSFNDQFDVLKMLDDLGVEGKKLLEIFEKIPESTDFKDFQLILNSTEDNRKMFPAFSDDASLLNLVKDLSRLYLNPGEHSKIRKDARNNYRRALKIIDHNQWGEPFDYLQKIFDKTLPGLTLESLSDKNEPKTNWSVFKDLYLTLDTFGFYGDSKVPNLIDDVFHSFFAAHCDVFVTDDERTLQKANAVYKKLSLSTVVCKPIDLLSWLNAKINVTNAHKSTKLTPQISYILSNSKNQPQATDSAGNDDILYKLETPLLSYFNRMQVTNYEDNGMILFLYKEPLQLNNFWFWTEIGSVVDKLSEQYGMDTNGKDHFNWQSDLEEIQTQTWTGRKWLSPNYVKELLFLEGSIGLAYRITIDFN